METKTEFIRVERFRLTPHFAERVFKHYARRIGRGEMPVAIQNELQSPEYFGENVNAKAAHLLNVIGGLAADRASRIDEKTVHAATQRAADHYGFGKLPMPQWPQEPETEKGSDEEEDGENDEAKKPEQGDDATAEEGGDGEPQEDDEGESEGDGSGEADDAEEADKERDGMQEQSDSDDDAEGEEKASGGTNGDASDGDSEGDEDGKGTAEEGGDGEPGGGSSLSGGRSERPVPEELDLSGQAKEIANYHERYMPPPEPHPIKPIPDCFIADKAFAFDYSRTNQLLAKLRAELMAVSRHRAYRDKDSGDVDFTKLTDLAQGTNLDRAFFTLTHAKRLNSAVQILMDISGSMGGTKIGTANALCYVLALTLEKLRIPCEVIAYDNAPYLVKPWHQKVDASPIRRVGSAGSTNLPMAMKSGLKSLGQRREARLIQAVLTDGDVGWRSASRDHALRMIAHLQKQAASEQDDRSREDYLNNAEAWRQDIVRGDSALRDFYRMCPRLETYGFGIEVPVPSGVFTKEVGKIAPSNMVNIIVETLGRALISKN